MALYVHAQDLYRSTLLGETLREALEEFLDEEITSSQKENDEGGGGGGEKEGEKEGDARPDSNHTNDNSLQQRQVEAGQAEDGGVEAVPIPAGPDVDGIQTLCLFELEKATCRAFSQLAGQDSGEQNEGCQLHGDIRSFTHSDNMWDINIGNAVLRQGGGILEQLGDVQLVALDIATRRLHITDQADRSNKKTRRTRGGGWSTVPSQFRRRR